MHRSYYINKDETLINPETGLMDRSGILDQTNVSNTSYRDSIVVKRSALLEKVKQVELSMYKSRYQPGYSIPETPGKKSGMFGKRGSMKEKYLRSLKRFNR